MNIDKIASQIQYPITRERIAALLLYDTAIIRSRLQDLDIHHNEFLKPYEVDIFRRNFFGFTVESNFSLKTEELRHQLKYPLTRKQIAEILEIDLVTLRTLMKENLGIEHRGVLNPNEIERINLLFCGPA